LHFQHPYLIICSQHLYPKYSKQVTLAERKISSTLTTASGTIQ